jgi:EmrB/QacA subfamily drug resistance transporter
MLPEMTPRTKNLALVLLAMTQFVIVLDAAIVNVALPSVGRALHFSQDNLSWVVNAYTLTFGGFLLLGGRLADLLGRRRMFIAGLVLFSLASLLGGLAQSDIWLVVARAAQGLGAAVIAPAALSLVTTMFAEGSERNRALGVWGAVSGSGGAAGVLLGGILTQYLGWEWVLFVNVPIGIGAALLAPRLLPESRDETRRAFDVAGAVTVTAGLAVLVYALVDAPQVGWGSTQTIALCAAALVLLGAFVAIESRTRHPLMPFSIFRLRTLRGANVIGLLLGMALFAMFFFLSLYMQQVLGYDALKAGLAYLPLAGTIIVTAGFVAAIVTRVGFKPPLVLGMVLTAVALLWFAQVDPHGTYVGDILFPSILVAVGLAFAFVPVTIAAVMGTRPEESGLASGLINTAQQIGGALGLAILAAVANSRTTHVLAAGERNRAAALTEGFQAAFYVGAGFAIVAAILAAVMISSRDSRAHAEAARAEGAEPAPVSAA